MASGRGSNFDAIDQAIQQKDLSAEILSVICDRPAAPVLEKARLRGVPAHLLPFPEGYRSRHEARLAHEEKVLEVLENLQPRFLVLAGYMRILTSNLIERFRSELRDYSRIVNIHPSILPAFPGVGGYAQAFRYGAKVAGVTVHLVEKEVDAGPICAQEVFSIVECETEQEVERKGLEVERRIYPQTLKWVLSEQFTPVPREGGRVYVRKN